MWKTVIKRINPKDEFQNAVGVKKIAFFVLRYCIQRNCFDNENNCKKMHRTEKTKLVICVFYPPPPPPPQITCSSRQIDPRPQNYEG